MENSTQLSVGPSGLLFADAVELKFYPVVGLEDDGKTFTAIIYSTPVEFQKSTKKDMSMDDILNDLDAFQAELKSWKENRNK